MSSDDMTSDGMTSDDGTLDDTAVRDPHVLGPGLLPTPFSADEIRRGSPSGRTVRTRVDPDLASGETAYVRVSRFAHCTSEGPVFEHWRETLDGTALGEVVGGRASWLDLQRHAAFPAASTVVTTETITTALGQLECRRYTVVDGSLTSTFWFDLGRPGMPVQTMDESNGRVVERSVMVSDERPAGWTPPS